MTKPNKGGYHPVDCKCGKLGCWSNSAWLTAWTEKWRKAGKPLPSNVPEKYRNLVVKNEAGETIIESKDGEIPTVGDVVKERLARKPLPLPSEIPHTVITPQVALRVNIPFGMIAHTINHQLPDDAPVTAKMDASKEQSDMLNQDVQDAFPALMVGPKLKLAIDMGLWALPALLFWIPRWLKGKFKNFRWPWSKTKQTASEPSTPSAQPPEVK